MANRPIWAAGHLGNLLGFYFGLFVVAVMG